MLLVKPSHKIMFLQSEALCLIEQAGRICYKSEDKLTKDSAKKFVKMVVKQGHHSVIEHANMTVRFVCDRGVTHEIVRHRLATYSQESTRYCNYKSGVTFVIPPWVSVKEGEYTILLAQAVVSSKIRSDWVWYKSMFEIERSYFALLNDECSPRQARAILPNSLKTEIVMTANLREWKHIFKLRCTKAAHPQMRELMIPLFTQCKQLLPEIFGGLKS